MTRHPITRRRLFSALGLGALVTAPDFPDWRHDVGHANAIAATGVPLTHLKRSLASPSAVAVGAGATVILPTASTFYTFTGVSYELMLQLSTTAGTATRVQLIPLWTDSTSGVVTLRESYGVYAGTTVAPHSVAGRGPTAGDQLQIVVSSPDNAITVSGAVLQRSVPYLRSLWHTIEASGVPSFPGFISAVADPDGNWLASRSITGLASGGHDDTLLPLYTGAVLLRGQTTGTAAGDGELQLLNTADSSFIAPNQTIYRLRSGQGDSTTPNEYSARNIPLPRAQCLLRLINNNAAAQTLTANITAQELSAG